MVTLNINAPPAIIAYKKLHFKYHVQLVHIAYLILAQILVNVYPVQVVIIAQEVHQCLFYAKMMNIVKDLQDLNHVRVEKNAK